MSRYIFFSGKGGVGKTTMACATAVHHALSGKKTLIVTTDPASNLADVFEQEIGHKITSIKGVGAIYPEGHRHELPLHAMEIDPDEATREYKENIIGPFREIMPEDVIASIEENLSGACTTEMASFDRFIDFMGTDEYDIVVFDTAPTGHTIRLLELPVDWSKHIEESAGGSGRTCLGPVQSIQGSKEKYDRAISILRDPSETNFIFVMRPEELSLYETVRASNELGTIGIRTGEIIINGIYPEEACEVEFFKKKFLAQQDVIKKAEKLIERPKRYMFLRDNEVKGIEALRDVAEELFKKAVSSQRSAISKKIPEDISRNTQPLNSPFTRKGFFKKTFSEKNNSLFLPENGTKAIFFTGKGGVGKTTVSCITALRMAEKGFKTLLVTTDPAAHIGEVLGKKVGTEPSAITDNLYAVMIESKTAFREYKEKVLNDAAGKYSEEMLAAMEEELNSPCIEEMAAFEKFAQFIESRDYDLLVFDTAPTGHTLRLLDLPFDYARQMEIMADASSGSSITGKITKERFSNIINMLRDSTKTVFTLVLYPESTPIEESYRAMIDLKNAGVETQFVIANMVLPEDVCTNNFFRNRRSMQMKYLSEISDKFKLPVAVYPLMEEEITGVEHLRAVSMRVEPQ
ncbi:MAG TPA: arsenic-transporting ATPase [Nitrospirae bacterium]|nr:arsenical pump-driving ATPase [bacterium BMS3Abin06]HDH11639.1 arsenic-transporting ATPase [Nitrospirota bacterium]HDZ02059.1 arsenic-transporting ATPase [Nitrospirota bacterium]